MAAKSGLNRISDSTDEMSNFHYYYYLLLLLLLLLEVVFVLIIVYCSSFVIRCDYVRIFDEVMKLCKHMMMTTVKKMEMMVLII